MRGGCSGRRRMRRARKPISLGDFFLSQFQILFPALVKPLLFFSLHSRRRCTTPVKNISSGKEAWQESCRTPDVRKFPRLFPQLTRYSLSVLTKWNLTFIKAFPHSNWQWGEHQRPFNCEVYDILPAVLSIQRRVLQRRHQLSCTQDIVTSHDVPDKKLNCIYHQF